MGIYYSFHLIPNNPYSATPFLLKITFGFPTFTPSSPKWEVDAALNLLFSDLLRILIPTALYPSTPEVDNFIHRKTTSIFRRLLFENHCMKWKCREYLLWSEIYKEYFVSPQMWKRLKRRNWNSNKNAQVKIIYIHASRYREKKSKPLKKYTVYVSLFELKSLFQLSRIIFF